MPSFGVLLTMITEIPASLARVRAGTTACSEVGTTTTRSNFLAIASSICCACSAASSMLVENVISIPSASARARKDFAVAAT